MSSSEDLLDLTVISLSPKLHLTSPLETLSQGPLLMFRKLIQELTRTSNVRGDPELDNFSLQIRI